MLTRPEWLLRIEAIAGLALALAVYQHIGKSWWVFAILALAPDLSMIGFAAGPTRGAMTYNAAHTAVLPFALAAIGVIAEWDWAIAIAAIWLAHIGVDRVLGFNLRPAPEPEPSKTGF